MRLITMSCASWSSACGMMGGIREVEQQVAILHGSRTVSIMSPVEQGSDLWMPGVSRKTIWASVSGEDALNGGARGLRLVGDDGELFADQRVQQRGFAGVGPAQNRNKTAI